MKKALVILTAVLFAVSLFVGCKNEPETKTYKVGDIGPADGIIFYDCDADNDSTNNGAGKDGLKSSACGWRYLEAAKENLELEDGTSAFVFGYYRVSGTNTRIWPAGSSDRKNYYIGEGKDGTDDIIKAMGEQAFTTKDGSDTTSNYAARVASQYRGGGYSDWFLPSIEEAVAMMNVKSLNVTITTNLWTTYEMDDTDAFTAPDTGSGNFTSFDKSASRPVRPVRRFM